jgi:SAM-dependent methyltransferase
VTPETPRPRHRWFAAFYARVIEPSDRKMMGPLREFAAGGAHGRVFEPGAGTGANLAHYDWSKVERLDLAEPDPYMRKHIEPKLAALPADVRERVHLSDSPAEALPFEDASIDCAVVTLVLCSVADPERALSELRRVLKPGGELRVIEHVAADGVWGKVQRAIQPVYGWMSGDCHLHRSTEAALQGAGFDVSVTERMNLGVPIVPAFAATAVRRDS